MGSPRGPELSGRQREGRTRWSQVCSCRRSARLHRPAARMKKPSAPPGDLPSTVQPVAAWTAAAPAHPHTLYQYHYTRQWEGASTNKLQVRLPQILTLVGLARCQQRCNQSWARCSAFMPPPASRGHTVQELLKNIVTQQRR